MTYKNQYGPFTYKVSFWCDIRNKIVTECGLLFAGTFAEAVKILENQYNLDCIDHLQALEPDSVVVLSEDTMNRIESGKDIEEIRKDT